MPITDEIIQSLQYAVHFQLPFGCETSPRIRELLLAIQHAPNLQSLDLAENNLGAWDLEKVQSFCAALAARQLQSLDLAENNLGAWDLEKVQSFCAALAASQLQSLDLSDKEEERKFH